MYFYVGVHVGWIVIGVIFVGFPDRSLKLQRFPSEVGNAYFMYVVLKTEAEKAELRREDGADIHPWSTFQSFGAEKTHGL